MKRDFLRELGLSDDVINQIMAENGKDVNNAKGDLEKITAERDQLKADLTKANETLDSFKDYDEVKANVEKYKADFEKSKKDYEKKIADMELNTKIKDFTNGKKFVNDLTREAINSQLFTALNADENKGKSLEEILETLTSGKENIFVDENKPVPPITPELKGDNPGESGVMAAFRRLNPNINI